MIIKRLPLAGEESIAHRSGAIPSRALTIGAMVMITQELLKESLSYNPHTGVFMWRLSRPRIHFDTDLGFNRYHSKQAGNECLSVNNKGYARVYLFGKYRDLHRLAFLYINGKFPTDQVDHINHICTDNRWVNLRHASSQENNRNKSLSSSNTSGCVGVVFHKKLCKWQAQVHIKPKTLYLGVFSNFFDACCASLSARNKHGFHENHGATKQGELS